MLETFYIFFEKRWVNKETMNYNNSDNLWLCFVPLLKIKL